MQMVLTESAVDILLVFASYFMHVLTMKLNTPFQETFQKPITFGSL